MLRNIPMDQVLKVCEGRCDNLSLVKPCRKSYFAAPLFAVMKYTYFNMHRPVCIEQSPHSFQVLSRRGTSVNKGYKIIDICEVREMMVYSIQTPRKVS